eukprot:gnl/TRDRNA2_/TRDRNA2_94673_c0_seq1.p2 gnl/TRDRNA2_/TRDRNA2_94673_c0~~gnl/TRDRNA2_/TRDRNA2_94673_c0_seq1.p2  ORF type:complete len:172 (-),score=48.68 gnl/TRDRNA2_/TRDRNA2_94673_c0_seq1:254-769(-)
MSEEASKVTLEEIKRESGEQAKEVMQIRQEYIRKAQANAQKNAYNAAWGYEKSMRRDMGLAAMWNLRATEYANAAGQRKGMAAGFQAEAAKYRATSQFNLAQKYILSAQQAMDQANKFAEDAKSAQKTAEGIQASTKWYLYAEQAIAATVLAGSMPPDVPPPGMPTLSFPR